MELEFLVDEGTIIVKDAIPGMKIPYALWVKIEMDMLPLLEMEISWTTVQFPELIVHLNLDLLLRIGVVEKGFIMAQLSVHTSPGHSSMPPQESSIGIMSNAVAKWVQEVVVELAGLHALPQYSILIFQF